MNRKNAIQTMFYAFAILAVVGLFVYQAEQNNRLEETLHENEKTLSETKNNLSQIEEELLKASYIIDEAKQVNVDLVAKLEDATKESEGLSEKVSTLTAKVSKMTSANEKLQNEYDTLKKNKAIAAEKAKQQPSSQSSTYQWKGKNNEYVAVSRSSNQTATKTFYVTATAYTAYCAGCSGITKTGLNLRKNPKLKVIAVDPKVIPLGTKVWVEGYGHAVAGDTGGAIKGNKVDLFMQSKSAANEWGRKKVQIKVF